MRHELLLRFLLLLHRAIRLSNKVCYRFFLLIMIYTLNIITCSCRQEIWNTPRDPLNTVSDGAQSRSIHLPLIRLQTPSLLSAIQSFSNHAVFTNCQRTIIIIVTIIGRSHSIHHHPFYPLSTSHDISHSHANDGSLQLDAYCLAEFFKQILAVGLERQTVVFTSAAWTGADETRTVAANAARAARAAFCWGFWACVAANTSILKALKQVKQAMRVTPTNRGRKRNEKERMSKRKFRENGKRRRIHMACMRALNGRAAHRLVLDGPKCHRMWQTKARFRREHTTSDTHLARSRGLHSHGTACRAHCGSRSGGLEDSGALHFDCEIEEATISCKWTIAKVTAPLNVQQLL